MTTFSHSGTFGDLIYSLAMVKHLGGGDFYLRLGDMDRMAKRVLGAGSAGDHTGEMTQAQFDALKPFMDSLPYINKFEVYTDQHIDHQLEEAGFTIVKQNGNYMYSYAEALGIDFYKHYKEFMYQPWLEVKDPIRVPGKPIVINRVNRHLYGCDPEAKAWREFFKKGLSDMAVYVGKESEHAWFEQSLGVKIQHYKTENILEVARVIAGAEQFMGSQSMCLSIAMGLGKTILCECRKDLPLQRNECYFIRPNVHYF